MSIKGSSAVQTLYRAYANAVFGICSALFPIDEKLIIFESEGDFCDNAYALYRDFLDMGLGEKYEFVWAVDGEYGNGIKTIKKTLKSPRTLWYMARAKHFLYDHNNMYAPLRKRKGQVLSYLGHGAGFKLGKGSHQKVVSEPDYRFTQGRMASKANAVHWNKPVELYTPIGTPRLDWFFSDLTEVNAKLEDAYGFSRYDKIGLWMPTFRKSDSADISDDTTKNETGLPLFTTDESLDAFDAFLKEQNVLMILKLHHLQSELPTFSRKYTNLLIVRDEDLAGMGVQLYQFIPSADFLVTDYSSISVDYLLLDRPIIYTLDDYDQYKSTRGLWPENLLDWFPGDHVYTEEEFRDSIKGILEGKDTHAEERARVRKEYYDHEDGNAGRRIAEFLGIE